MRIIEELSTEARKLEAREEDLVKEINHYKNLMRSSLLAPLRIKELHKQLDGVREHQKAIDFQIIEVQMQQITQWSSGWNQRNQWGNEVMARDWEKEQLETLVNTLEEERILMELWCWKREISYIESFLDYQNKLIDWKNEIGRAHV